MLFGYEVQCVQCLGLRFGDWRDIWRPRLGEESGKIPPSILDEHPLWSGLRGWLMVQKWTDGVWDFRVVEPEDCEPSKEIHLETNSYPSRVQFWERV